MAEVWEGRDSVLGLDAGVGGTYVVGEGGRGCDSEDRRPWGNVMAKHRRGDLLG